MLTTTRVAIALFVGIGVTHSEFALAQVQFLQEPAGQFNGSSCQSYSLSVALAFQRDPSFKIGTASQLRTVEEGIRAKIVEAAGPGHEVSHEHIKIGFKAYSGGGYLIRERAFANIAAFGDYVKATTGVGSAAAVPPAFLLDAVVKDAVLISVRRVGTSAYESGHFISILGVDGPPNSARRYLVLNGGIKVAGAPVKLTCLDGVPDKQSRYDAGVSWIAGNDIDFKQFDGKFIVWTVGKP